MSQFTDFLSEVLIEFGEISTRKMFGGYGVYHQGTMFGLVADDMLYLKADASTEAIFRAEGLKSFEYDKGDKIVKMSYFQAPDIIFDDPLQASKWAKIAFDVAQNSKK